MANPYSEITHGLEPTVHRAIRKIVRREGTEAGKSWVEQSRPKHAPANDDAIVANDNEFAPGALFENLFGEMWQNADKLAGTEHSELYQLAEREALKELSRVLDTNATLKLPPEDFMRLRTQMEEIAQTAVKETRNLVATEKMPVGMNAFREKVKNTVNKYIGSSRSPTRVQPPTNTDEAKPAPAPVPTLSHLCSHFNFEIRLPFLSLPTHSS